MPRKAKAKAPHKPRPKRSGAEQPSKPKRARKQAAKPTELVASTAAPRCGQEGCPVCDAQPCNDCYGCRRAAQKGWDPAKQCEVAKIQRRKPCPNTAPAPRDDGVDPRKLDKKGPHFKASDDIIEIMDALDGSAELEPPVRRALGCFKHSLDVSGRLDARWASLDGIHALDDYDVDDINADNNAQNAIEGAVRWVHFKGGSKPSVEEMGKMGPLEKRTVLRVLSYVASMQHRTKAQMKGRPPALGASLSDQARNAFVKLVEGGKWDGKHVCKALARKEDEPWPKYWQGAVDSASKAHTLRIDRRSGGAMRFVQLVNSLRLGAPQWACTAEMRAWFEARQCQYQRIMIVC